MKKKYSKVSTIFASYETDLGLILNWLRLNKVIIQAGEIRKSNSIYSVTVKTKVPKSEVRALVKDRFGIFAKVK